MSTTDTNRDAYIAELTERYAAEISFLRDHDRSPEVVWTGRGETALQATAGPGRRMLATNGDACLVGSRDEDAYGENPRTWCVGLYNIGRSVEADTWITEGIGDTLEAAYRQAFASLAKSDHDAEKPETKTTRVAVRAVTSGTFGVNSDHTEAWKILEVPTEILGDYDAEATVIIDDLGMSFVSDVIVVDKDVEGFAAGCSTWARFGGDPNYDDDYESSEHAQAAREHWNCEHTLFGATPTEGWTQVTDAAELDAHDTLELWTFRTGEYAEGEYEALVARFTWDPETYRLTVFRDEHGPLCEQVQMEGLDDAKSGGIATIVDAIEGL
ncbi:hypothetical protein ACQPW1_00320 [Nocardia sp. CA-128927]|uniref:hypothetical protein n=1 Tax=Nocardia sp. CA-128927 TaxID=3239975 RepID=UPI003D987207